MFLIVVSRWLRERRWNEFDHREIVSFHFLIGSVGRRPKDEESYLSIKLNILGFWYPIRDPMVFPSRWSRKEDERRRGVSNSRKRVIGAITRHSFILIVHWKGNHLR
jgi:hypothetical protein